MMSSKYNLLLPVILACIAGAVIYTAKNPAPVPDKSDLGVAAFTMACSAKGNRLPECASVETIREAYRFDLMTEINAVHGKMRKTATDIADGKLTDEAYQTCLAAGKCASVPMLGKEDDPKSPQGKKISRTFWTLVNEDRLTPEICALIQTCDIGLRNGALVASKNAVVPAKRPKS